MEGRGFGSVADLLAFAMLVSTAIALFAVVSPIDPTVEGARYASSFARGALLSLQHCTTDQLGGFEYSLGAFGFELDIPFMEGSARRTMSHKTLAQLLAEDALLNMRVDIGETNLAVIRPNQDLDDKLKDFLKSCLGRIIGGRFGYRLLARAEPIDLGIARVYFDIQIEDLGGARNQLCSEAMLLALPVTGEEILQLLGRDLGVDIARSWKTDLVVEVSLELWSK